MKNSLSIVILLCFLGGVHLFADAVGTPFSYQGYLQESGKASSGAYDMTFTLYDAATDGIQVGSLIEKADVSVEKGVFSQELDFGEGIFDGTALWLEVAVRHAGSGSYETLSPRQEVTAAPYAQYALKVASVADHDYWGDTWSGYGSGLTLQSADATAVNAQNTDTGNQGALGTPNYGVYGKSTSDDAGYFDGRVTVKNGTFELNNSVGQSWINIQRGEGENGGVAYKESGEADTQWIFPYFRGWQSDNLIVRDETKNIDVMTFEIGTGKVGIGTGTPSARLEVNGNVNINRDLNVSGNYQFTPGADRFLLFPDSLHSLFIGGEGTQYPSPWRVYLSSRDSVRFDIDNLQRLKIDTSGAHLYGNLVVDGNITHTTKTGHLSIPAAAWHCGLSSSHDDDCVGWDTFIKLSDPDSGYYNYVDLITPVYLPNGVKVTQVLVWADSISPTNVRLILYSFENGPKTKRIMASILSSDRTGLAPYHHDDNNTISDSIIDNNSKSYYISATLWKNNDETLRLYSVRITYTYDSTDK